jgi:uncharacterized membrane protein YbhN (UPF0104 family)
MTERLRAALPALVGLALFVAALVVLRQELGQVSWHELSADVSGTPIASLAAAVILTAVKLRRAHRIRLSRPCLCWPTAATVPRGGRIFSGLCDREQRRLCDGVRHVGALSLLHAVGHQSGRTVAPVVFYVVTFWLGLVLLGGVSLVAMGLPGDAQVASPALARAGGWLLIALAFGYVMAAVLRVGPLSVGRVTLPVPSPTQAFSQLAVSVLDWVLAGAVLFVLLPSGSVPFLALIGAFSPRSCWGLPATSPAGSACLKG